MSARRIAGLAAFVLACSLLTNLDDLGGSLDASCDGSNVPCLAAVDPRWEPVATTLTGCAAGWSTLTLRTNPRPLDGGCTCTTCTVDADVTCTSATVAGGPGCGTGQQLVEAGACAPFTIKNYVRASPSNPVGPATCAVAVDAAAASDSIVLCEPGCSSDYCGAANRCVMTDGDVTCPSGFSPYAHGGATVDPGCPACTCAVNIGSCGGTATTFEAANCADSGLSMSSALGSCDYIPFAQASVRVDLTPPPVSCVITSPTASAGDASLVGSRTICCQ